MTNCTRSMEPPASQSDWRMILSESVRDPAELCRLLELPPDLAWEMERAAGTWPLWVPRPYLARMRHGDPTDPLLLQVMPQAAETIATPGYRTDPLEETSALHTPSLLQKYQGRSLILATGTCSVHCRFCFRRHFPHKNTNSADLQGAIKQIAADPSIHEVILSGGDPLLLSDEEFGQLLADLAKIPHIRRVRTHTRMPVIIPQRVTAGLVACLRGIEERGERRAVASGQWPVASEIPQAISHVSQNPKIPKSQNPSSNPQSTILVIHINHPAEIDDNVAVAIGRLVDAGIPVLSQSVLLRGVNDRVEALAELFERLIDLRAIPYYLHHLDPVAGAAHFEVPVSLGLDLMGQLRDRLPGYAVPRYVRETPGQASKTILGC